MPDLNELIEKDLEGLTPMDRVVRMASLIEFYGQQVPAVLAQMRSDEIRELAKDHTPQEIHQGTGINPNRVRKLVDRR